MPQTISTTITIQASAEQVWTVLTDFESYPTWNPFIKLIEGDIQVGHTFKAMIHAPNNKPMVFKPRVLVFTKSKEFKWLGHLWFKGLFDGEHRFQLLENSDGSTALIQSEQFTGLLVPLFKSMLKKDTLEGFRLMNEALKKRVEAAAN
jgi:hypothetical protein